MHRVQAERKKVPRAEDGPTAGPLSSGSALCSSQLQWTCLGPFSITASWTRGRLENFGVLCLCARPRLLSMSNLLSRTLQMAFSWPSGSLCAQEFNQIGAISWWPLLSKQSTGTLKEQWAGRKGKEWHLVPNSGQHFSGQAKEWLEFWIDKCKEASN